MIKINDINYVEIEGVNILTSPCIRNFLNAFSHMPPEFRDRYSLSLPFRFSIFWNLAKVSLWTQMYFWSSLLSIQTK